MADRHGLGHRAARNPEQVVSLDVTEGVLPILGVQPVLGRSFSRQDDTPGSPETVMLTYGYWRSKFGGDPAVIGQRCSSTAAPAKSSACCRRTFRFLDRKPALMLPLRLDRNKTFLGNFSFTASHVSNPASRYRRRARTSPA